MSIDALSWYCMFNAPVFARAVFAHGLRVRRSCWTSSSCTPSMARPRWQVSERASDRAAGGRRRQRPLHCTVLHCRSRGLLGAMHHPRACCTCAAIVWQDGPVRPGHVVVIGPKAAARRLYRLARWLVDSDRVFLYENIRPACQCLDGADGWQRRLKHHLWHTHARLAKPPAGQRDSSPSACGAMAGNSVHVDRLFLLRCMPRVMEHLSYRIVDVSSIKELSRRCVGGCARVRAERARGGGGAAKQP